MKTVEVIIDSEGNVKVETRGIVGAGCEALSRAIEESLGVATSNVKKPEFYQGTAQQQATAGGGR